MKTCPPVNPTEMFIAAYHRVALTVNPSKYHGVRPAYGRWLELGLALEQIVPMHQPSYYSNNLLSMVWYVVSRYERASGASTHWAAIESKLETLASHYAPHLQANLPAYWVAASNATSERAALWTDIVGSVLWDHPPPPDTGHAVSQRNNSLYGPDVSCSESCGCSSHAILVRDRPQSEFIWQIDPTKLSGGSDRPADQPQTQFGGAFLLPFYVVRSAGVF